MAFIGSDGNRSTEAVLDLQFAVWVASPLILYIAQPYFSERFDNSIILSDLPQNGFLIPVRLRYNIFKGIICITQIPAYSAAVYN